MQKLLQVKTIDSLLTKFKSQPKSDDQSEKNEKTPEYNRLLRCRDLLLQGVDIEIESSKAVQILSNESCMSAVTIPMSSESKIRITQTIYSDKEENTEVPIIAIAS
jgi:hypothetical protein